MLPSCQPLPAPVRKTVRYTPSDTDVEYWCMRLEEVYGRQDAGTLARTMAARLQ